MALVFSLPLQREVMIMSDCEMLVNFIMIITMAFSIHSISHKNKTMTAIRHELCGAPNQSGGNKPAASAIHSCRYYSIAGAFFQESEGYTNEQNRGI